MAQKDGFTVIECDSLERQWIVKALQTQRSVLMRAIGKEMPGSEIYALRQHEIATLTLLINRL